MSQEIRGKITVYLNNQFAQAENRLSAYTLDPKGRKNFKRKAVAVLEKYLSDFKKKGREPRWIIIPGIRGVGKTTILAQIYSELVCQPGHKLYISLDEARKILDVSLRDILIIYEEILGKVFEDLSVPVFLFIDEAQYDDDWAIVLKSLYDRSKKVFILCTGSSALLLQTNTDISRRAVFEKIYPMSFTEYLLLKDRKKTPDNFSEELKKAVFTSNNATELFENLKSKEKTVGDYWFDVKRPEVDNYLKFGSLPFTLQYTQESLIYSQIEQTLTNIINKDIPRLGRFDQGTMARLNQILYAVSSSNVLSLAPFAQDLNIAINTLTDVLDVFEKSELLLRILPHGSHYGQVKKPSKYLFITPSYRNMFFNLFGSTLSFDNYKGFLLEDVVGLYFYRILGLRFGTSLTYDSAAEGADFIVNFNNKNVAVEVGYNKTDYRQIDETAKKIKINYGLSISSKTLSLSENKAYISLPLNYFLLL